MNCQYENCSNLSTYGLSYGNATHCKIHKLDGLKLVSQFCKTIGCNKRPGFNYENSNGKLYCVEHKKDEMISKDNRKCLEENCTSRPSCNYESEDNPIYCSIGESSSVCERNTTLRNSIGQPDEISRREHLQRTAVLEQFCMIRRKHY